MSAYPRVNKSTIGGYVNSQVLLVGKMQNNTQNPLQIVTQDGGIVEVHVPGDLQLPGESDIVVEVLGTVNGDLSVQPERVTSLKGLDMSNYGGLLEVMADPEFNDMF
eukprot:TRINITY_DN778222_c0_g1_i1.p1 TRINITY_DN778222_c0_g1~~TRINITY_DN778222_c0_g1_i1.p1  ORF type:complete len:107 (+),score=25.97 TRINITY_DN778222_c0_g1_i1:50-370(+)